MTLTHFVKVIWLIVKIVPFPFHSFPFIIACAFFLSMANVTWYKAFEL